METYVITIIMSKRFSVNVRYLPNQVEEVLTSFLCYIRSTLQLRLHDKFSELSKIEFHTLTIAAQIWLL